MLEVFNLLEQIAHATKISLLYTQLNVLRFVIKRSLKLLILQQLVCCTTVCSENMHAFECSPGFQCHFLISSSSLLNSNMKNIFHEVFLHSFQRLQGWCLLQNLFKSQSLPELRYRSLENIDGTMKIKLARYFLTFTFNETVTLKRLLLLFNGVTQRERAVQITVQHQ